MQEKSSLTSKITMTTTQKTQTATMTKVSVSSASIITWADGNTCRLAHAIFALKGKEAAEAGEPAIYIASHYEYALKIAGDVSTETMILNNADHHVEVEEIINAVKRFRSHWAGDKRITVLIENGRFIKGTSFYIETELYDKLKEMGCRVVIGYDYIRSFPTLSEYSQRTYLFSTYRLASEAYFVEDGYENDGSGWEEASIITTVRGIQETQKKPELYMMKNGDELFSHAVFIDDDSAPKIKLSTGRFKIDPDHEKRKNQRL